MTAEKYILVLLWIACALSPRWKLRSFIIPSALVCVTYFLDISKYATSLSICMTLYAEHEYLIIWSVSFILEEVLLVAASYWKNFFSPKLPLSDQKFDSNGSLRLLKIFVDHGVLAEAYSISKSSSSLSNSWIAKKRGGTFISISAARAGSPFNSLDWALVR